MKLTAPVYCCTECKKIINSLEQLLFVEENSTKGFCSEECIEFFYSSMLKHYEQALHNLRLQLELQNETVVFEESDEELIEKVIHSPSEVWRARNELNEEIFSYIKHFSHGSVVIVCSVLNAQPSYIFLVTKTHSPKLVAELRIGERINLPESESTDDTLSDLEVKKSHLLAELIGKRSSSDIPFEDFTSFDFCLNETLQAPDETFQFKDRDGDLLITSIKSFHRDNKNFFYIVVSFNNINILSFPTEDIKLYAEFRVGKQLSSNFKN